MGTTKQDDIYTNIPNGKNILTHSKTENTKGKNDVKKMNEIIQKINKTKKESD